MREMGITDRINLGTIKPIKLNGTVLRKQSGYDVAWKMRNMEMRFQEITKDINILAKHGFLNKKFSSEHDIVTLSSETKGDSTSSAYRLSGLDSNNTIMATMSNSWDADDEGYTDIDEHIYFSKLGFEILHETVSYGYGKRVDLQKMVKCINPLWAITMSVENNDIKAFHFILRPYAYKLWMKEKMNEYVYIYKLYIEGINNKWRLVLRSHDHLFEST
jgi:hypothetical protein